MHLTDINLISWVALTLIGSAAIFMVWVHFSNRAQIREEKRQVHRTARQRAMDIRACRGLRASSCFSLCDRDIELIRRNGIEKAAEILNVHPPVLVRSLKVRYAKR